MYRAVEADIGKAAYLYYSDLARLEQLLCRRRHKTIPQGVFVDMFFPPYLSLPFFSQESISAMVSRAMLC